MSDISARVTRLIIEHLDVEVSQVKPEARFTDDLSADSLDLVELLMALEEEFGVEIPDSEAAKITKVGDAINYITENVKNNN